jgi:hypothetical protein
MGRDRKNEKRQQQFTKWIHAHRLLPAWQALTFPARDAYFHLQVRCFADTKPAATHQQRRARFARCGVANINHGRASARFLMMGFEAV